MAAPSRRRRFEQWKAWLRSELAAPRAEPLSYDGLPPEAAETLETFRTIARLRVRIDREAFGALILSMTRSAADILAFICSPRKAACSPIRRRSSAAPCRSCPARDHSGSAPRGAILKELLACRCAAQPLRAGQSPGSHDRVLGFQQGGDTTPPIGSSRRRRAPHAPRPASSG